MRFGAIFFLFLPCALAGNSPTFTYSLSAGSVNASINAIATDSAGNTYLTGSTLTAAITATPDALQPQITAPSTCGFFGHFPQFCHSSFIVKLDPTGAVVFATYFGGNGDTIANAIAVDRQGNVYVAGTTSPGVSDTDTFPVTPGAAFTERGVNINRTSGFITKLNPSGSQLLYSTFIPGGAVSALALDPDGNAYVAGTGSSSSPVTAGAFQGSPTGSYSFPGFVAKLNASGSALVYGTYLSGSGGPSGGEILTSIAVDAAGHAFVAGYSRSPDFPLTPGAFRTTSLGPRNTFLTKLNPQGSGLIFSTYLCADNAYDVAVKLDAQGTAFVSGSTSSYNFPTTPGAMQRGSGILSGFLTRFNVDGSSLIYSTYVPVVSYPRGALDVDSAGNAVIAGTASSLADSNVSAPDFANLPTGPGAFQPAYGGGTSDAYVARFTPDGHLSASTYLGGPQDDFGGPIALAPNGSVVVAGSGNVTSVFPSLTVLNSASYVATAVAPGELVSLLGYGIGPETGVSAGGPVLPTDLAGVQVSFGGIPAPLLYVQAHVINAQVPWELAGQTSTTVRVSYPGVAPANTPIAVTPTLPGIFAVSNSNGSRNSPSNPTRSGDFVTIYGTGGGPTNPGAVTGAFWSPATPLPLLTQEVSVIIGGADAGIIYAGASPQSSSGIFQINVRIPSDLPPSQVPLELTIGNASSLPVPITIGTSQPTGSHLASNR